MFYNRPKPLHIKGRVYKFGDNINTDIIYPGKYLSITTEREEMARHCFETVYPEFLKIAEPGDIIVAGRNFGCGSSREQAATCLKYFGISAVVAESFARIFYRNAINLGLTVVIAPGISKKLEHNDIIEVDLKMGIIISKKNREELKTIRLPSSVLEILSAGGLVPYLRKKLGVEQ
ncbi:3-isopropylmalate dehydratase [candidate division WOR-3 bacterium RBG_13_43_14]|uniref:3-isopropylmalate dehydratase small subunit n=1 Tax=candidate division WOR-3 bacterium RBG_13_43_14 TaxID=1802590 RepID=A0A1F4UAK3_UNCW3|nr:MAG: 3-isopropylmalate dehydratase [candidate division WOR-3 bacterium RBG_13_43_14]